MWGRRKAARAVRPTGSGRTHIAARGGAALAAGAPGSSGMGTGWGKDQGWGDPTKGPRGREGCQGRKGGGGGEGKRCGGKREGAHWPVAVAAQAHLGGRWEGARGLAQAHPQGRREKPGSTRSRSIAGFASRPLPYTRAAPAATPSPAPILSANGQRRWKTVVQKQFRLEICSPIGSGESRGWRGR